MPLRFSNSTKLIAILPRLGYLFWSPSRGSVVPMVTLVMIDSTISLSSPITEYTLCSTLRINALVTAGSVPVGSFTYTYTLFGSPCGKNTTLGLRAAKKNTEPKNIPITINKDIQGNFKEYFNALVYTF